MGHLDDELLAAAALGEDLPDGVARHLATCESCGAEVAEYRRVLAIGRSGASRDARESGLERPPAAVWERIAGEVGFDGADEVPRDGEGEFPPEGARARGTDGPDGEGDGGPDGEGDAGPDGEGEGAPSGLRRWRTSAIVWTAAASVAVGAGAGVAISQALRSGATEPQPVASAVLDPLPGWSVPGTADVTDRDGRLELTVDLPDDSQSGYQEVWLISTDLTRLISLGVLDGDSGTFALPAGIDLADFAIVDISDEAFDGNPGHSGISIVRGELAPPVA